MSSEAPTSAGASQPEVILAKWSDRFFAWLIDFVLVNVTVWGVLAAASFPFWFGNEDGWFGPGPYGGPARYAIGSTAFFLYWTFFETTKGQSIGKIVMKLKTVNLVGGWAGGHQERGYTELWKGVPPPHRRGARVDIYKR